MNSPRNSTPPAVVIRFSFKPCSKTIAPPAPALAETTGRQWLNCLYRCEPTVLDVARGLAVLGADASLAELGELVGAGPEMAAMAVELMTAAGLLEGGAFRHPAGILAVLDDILPQDRANLHRRAARLLHVAGASAVAVARHLVNAGHIADLWVTGVLVEAADQALFADEVALAVECLALAQLALPDDKSRVAVRANWPEPNGKSTPPPRSGTSRRWSQLCERTSWIPVTGSR